MIHIRVAEYGLGAAVATPDLCKQSITSNSQSLKRPLRAEYGLGEVAVNIKEKLCDQLEFERRGRSLSP